MESDNFLSINLKQGLSRQESDSEAHSSVLGHVQHFPFNVVLFRKRTLLLAPPDLATVRYFCYVPVFTDV